MISVSPIAKQGSFKHCGACGPKPVDQKMQVCGQCRIVKYCDRKCQAAAWPKHKEVCVLNSHRGSLEKICKRKFGHLKGMRILKKDVRILSHAKGFTVFFPKDIWPRLNSKIPLCFPQKKAGSEIAGEEFAFLKCTVLSDATEYVSNDSQRALDKIETFVEMNFFMNKEAFPKSIACTHSVEGKLPGGRPFEFTY